MNLYKLTENELRSLCKEHIEALELWLRRLIDDEFTSTYGTNYFDKTKDDGSNLISSKIKKEVKNRKESNPNRFSRLIDACLLEEEIKIITNPIFYKNHFDKIFRIFFTNGNSDMIRIMMNSLVEPRNKLYHANPISVRESERIICYSNDIIGCIKTYYSNSNMEQEFNVPLILKYKDSFGNIVFRKNFGKNILGAGMINHSRNKQYFLRPGDTISIEIEVDPSFEKEFYSLRWTPKIENSENSNKFTYCIQTKDIGENFNIAVKLVTTNEWHRLNGWDDYLVTKFKVLPNKN